MFKKILLYSVVLVAFSVGAQGLTTPTGKVVIQPTDLSATAEKIAVDATNAANFGNGYQVRNSLTQDGRDLTLFQRTYLAQLTDHQKALLATADQMHAQGVPVSKMIDMAYASGENWRDVTAAFYPTTFSNRADLYPSGLTGMIDKNGRNISVEEARQLANSPSLESDLKNLGLNGEHRNHLMAIKYGTPYTTGHAYGSNSAGQSYVDSAGNFTDAYYSSPLFNAGARPPAARATAATVTASAISNDGSFFSPTMNRTVSAAEIKQFFASNPSKAIVAQVAKDMGIDAAGQAKIVSINQYGSVYSPTQDRTISSDEVNAFFASGPSADRVQQVASQLGISSADLARVESAVGYVR